MRTPGELPMAPYQPRRTQPLGVVERAGWAVKITGITAGGAIDHERRAWVAHVLERPADPDLAGYLAATLTVEG
jgi:hypothetical protein